MARLLSLVRFVHIFWMCLAASLDYLCESIAKGHVNATKEFKPADSWAGQWEGYYFGVDEVTGISGYILDKCCLPLFSEFGCVLYCR